MIKQLFYLFTWAILFFSTMAFSYEKKDPIDPTNLFRTDLAMCVPKAPTSANVMAIADGNWNNPAIWSGGILPTMVDDVNIPSTRTVTLQGNIRVKSIMVNGRLRAIAGMAAGTDIDLEAEYIAVNGSSALLEIGTETTPYLGECLITLIGTNDGDNHLGMGDKYIVALNGGTLHFHGEQKKSWSRIDQHANAGANQIHMMEAVDWEVGDEITIASAVFSQDQAEERTITNISADLRTITLNSALDYTHFGENLYYDNGKTGASFRSWNVENRTEVGRLTRNIKIQGDANAETTGYGGHIMIMPGAKGYADNIELFRMGQQFHIGRYPFHWHLCGNVSGQYLKNASIHHTYNRATVIHGTQNALLEDNMVFHIWGSAIFLEDAVETGNVIKRNLVMNVYVPPHAPSNTAYNAGTLPGGLDNPLGIVPSDYQHDGIRVKGPTAFWITNPDNTFEDNVVAGSAGVAYWFGLPAAPTGESAGTTGVFPRTTLIRSFKGNMAHSVLTGLHFDHSHNAAQEEIQNAGYTPTVNGVGAWAIVEDFTCYKMDRGWWTRTHTSAAKNIEFINIKLLDGEGDEMVVSAWKGRMRDCLFVGNSAHNTLPTNSAFCSALAFYDGGYEVYDSHFQDFDLDYLSVFSWFGGAADRSNDFFKDCTFLNSTIYNDRYIMRPMRLSGCVRDIDGTITGLANASILPEHPYLLDDQNFERIQAHAYGHKSTIPLHVAKIEIKGSDTPYENSIYSEWGDGHTVSGSVWGASNQFAVIPNIGRVYTFRWLNEIGASNSVQMRYAKNGDVVDAIFEGSPVQLNVSGATARTSINAVRTSTVSAYYWESATKRLHVRFVAGNDYDPSDYEYAAYRYLTVSPAGNVKQQALTTYALDPRPYEGTASNVDEIIEAEHFDYGGQFKAYLEMGAYAPNPITNISGNRYTGTTYSADILRLGTVVQLGKNTNSFSNELAINNISSGEYWNYTIDIPSAGNYTLNFRGTTNQVSNLQIKVDGVNNSTFSIPNTYNFPIKHELGTLALPAGTHTITVLAQTNGIQFDWFGLVSPGNPPLADALSDDDGDGMTNAVEWSEGRDATDVCDIGFEFLNNDNFENWAPRSTIIEQTVSNGILSGNSTNADPYIPGPNLFFSGNEIQTIQVRMRADQNGTTELFWKNEDGGFSGTRRVTTSYTGNGNWQIVTLDPSAHAEWLNHTILQLRIDPVNKTGNFEIDWIRGTCCSSVGDVCSDGLVSTTFDVVDLDCGCTCLKTYPTSISPRGESGACIITGKDETTFLSDASGLGLVAILDQGENLGLVVADSYNHNPTAQTNMVASFQGKYILDRSFKIEPASQPTNPVKVQLFIGTGELQRLIDKDPMVSSINDLVVSKYSGGTLGVPATGTDYTIISPTALPNQGPNNTHILEFEVSSFSTFFIHGDGPLPIELAKFNGESQGCDNLIYWETASEENNKVFVLQHSLDGRNFAHLAEIDGAGTSTETNFYQYTHQNLQANTNYYRLIQYDFDGSFTESELITITSDCHKEGNAVIYPNPTKDGNLSMQIDVFEAVEGEIIITDIIGRQIIRNPVSLQEGNNLLTIDLGEKATGTYFIRLETNAWNTKVFKILKVK